MYGMLSRAKRRYRVGNAAVGYATLMKAPSQAERWAWDCVYPKPHAAAVRKLEEQHGLPRGLVHALMRQESAFDPAVVSPATAVGLMQLMPSTGKAIAAELSMTDYDPAMLTNPELNLKLGAFYIAKLLKTFQGSIPLAAAAYNAGPKAVSHWLAVGKDHDADLWVARIPYDETRGYVAKVMGNLAATSGSRAATPRCSPSASSCPPAPAPSPTRTEKGSGSGPDPTSRRARARARFRSTSASGRPGSRCAARSRASARQGRLAAPGVAVPRSKSTALLPLSAPFGSRESDCRVFAAGGAALPSPANVAAPEKSP